MRKIDPPQEVIDEAKRYSIIQLPQRKSGSRRRSEGRAFSPDDDWVLKRCECCGEERFQTLFMWQNRYTYYRKDICIVCQTAKEYEKLLEAMRERKFEKAEKRRRKKLTRHIRNYKVMKERQRQYAKRKQKEETGKGSLYRA